MLIVLVAGCGGGTPPPPPPKKLPPPSYQPTKPTKVDDSTDDETPENPSGGGLSFEFKKEHQAAFDAWKEWGEKKTGESYAKAGTHIYRAMALMKRHELNKQSASSLASPSKLRKLKELMIDFKKSHGAAPRGWDNDPEYKKAFADYNELGD
jgi:hypothetical protein